MPSPGETPRVYLIGTGLPEKEGATLEAMAALKGCGVVFAPDPSDGFFQRWCRDVRPHGNLSRGEDRRRCVEEVLAASRGAPVAFAIYGHPMYYEPITELLTTECRFRGVPVKVVNGISAADAVLAALRWPLGYSQGLLVCDVRHYLAHRPPREVCVLVYKFAMDEASHPKMVRALMERRPADEEVAIVECRRNAGDEDRVEWVAVGRLIERLEKPLGLYASLFIPSAPKRIRWRGLLRAWIRLNRVIPFYRIWRDDGPRPETSSEYASQSGTPAGKSAGEPPAGKR